MDSLFDRLFHRGSGAEGMHAAIGYIEGVGPVHWLDVMPRESKDKPCSIKSLDVIAHVSGLYAEVEQTLAIENPNERPISASVTIPMPDRAVVCGYGLDIDGMMVDGVVVEKEKARVAFETEQRRGADPGLVESVRGNVYRTRVYPVPALGTRTLMLRYVAPLVIEGGVSAAIHLLMPAEHLDHRSVRIEVEMLDAPKPVIRGIGSTQTQEVNGLWCTEISDEDVTPTEPVLVSLPELPETLVLLERDDNETVWFSASERLPEQVEDGDSPTITALTVLWDASGSRADQDHDRELKLLRAWSSSSTIKKLSLVVFSNRVLKVEQLETADQLVSYVRSLRYDGGTDLVALSNALNDMPELSAGVAGGEACVLFTDGLDTLSDQTFSLPEGCDALAVVSGSERDMELLRQACRGLAYDVDHAPRDAAGLAAAFSSGNPVRTLLVKGTGIADVLDSDVAGSGRRVVIGKLTTPQTSITLGEGGMELNLREEDARLGNVLAHAWAARRVAQLSPRATEFADDLLDLGRSFGVASPVTSLLVLESLDQWLRYDIEPPRTWESMHSAWKRAKAGEMHLFSEDGRKAAHRSDLANQWRRTLEWWERDFEEERRLAEQLERERREHTWSHEPEEEGSATGYIDFEMDEDLGDFASFGDEAYPDSAPMPLMESAAPRPMAMSAPASAPSSYIGSEPRSALRRNREGGPSESRRDNGSPSVSVTVRPWMPDAPYLKALDKALESGIKKARKAYHKARLQYRNSPSFFLDCAGWFMAHDDEDFGVCVLSNLAELRIEDAALLRVLGWRLREAGRLEQALIMLRRVLKLRNEDSQSHRDVALVLDELARSRFAEGKEDEARAFAEEAAKYYRETALTPWSRRAMAIGLFAVEEYNVLRAWADAQTWEQVPDLPSLGDGLEGVLACDLRITLAWDADETDVDIHVTEPSGEEAYYGHRNTSSGGRVSEDITDGYGPELYEIRRAPAGIYNIRAHYFASHQQTVFGPATCTLTVYTDWGRDTQAQQVTSRRLDREKEMMDVGTAAYGEAAIAEAEARETESDTGPEQTSQRNVEVGMGFDEVREIMGEPEDTAHLEWEGTVTEEWTWELSGGRKHVVRFVNGTVTLVAESMPWGETNIEAQ